MGLKAYARLTHLLGLAMTAEVANTFLFVYFLSAVANELGLSRGITALLGYGPLAAGVLGGYVVGLVADLFGRKTGLLFSLFLSGLGAILTGLSRHPGSLVAARLIIGLTLAGTWAAAVVLGNESVASDYRGRISAAVQVGFPLGNLLCSALVSVLGPKFGWHGTFVGLGLIIWSSLLLLQLTLNESPQWLARESKTGGLRLTEVLRPAYRRTVATAGFLALLGMFSGFALQTSVPRYLESVGFAAREIPLYTALAWVAATLGYAHFGPLADRFGHLLTLITYMLATVVFSLVLGVLPPFLAKEGFVSAARYLAFVFVVLMMYATGFFSGYGPLYSALFPTDIRTNAVGFSFNLGRVGNALAPFTVEMLAERVGMGPSLALVSLPLGLAALIVWWHKKARVPGWEEERIRSSSVME